MTARARLARLGWMARREYLERLRSRTFMVATVLGPVIMAAFILGPGLLLTRQPGPPLRLAVLDDEGTLRAAVEQSLRRRTVNGQPRFDVRSLPEETASAGRDRARRAVLAGELDGFLYLPRETLDLCRAEYHGKYVSNVMDIELLDGAVEDALLARRLESAGVARDQVKQMTRRLDLKTVRLSARGEREDGKAAALLALVLLMMLYAAVAMWGQAIMNGVIEEKANRVVEVLVSSVPAWVIFTGKLLGVGAAGLTQFVAWGASLALLGSYAAARTTLMPEVSPTLMVALIGFFLLGYFLYGALYAAVGAAVNTQQEAQVLAFPVLSPLVAGIVFFPIVLSRPDSGLSVALTMIPFFTPLLMFLRVAILPPPAWQVALSVALTVGAISAVTWAAARIYRVGILMYGKRATLPEMLRWVGRD